MNIVIVMPTFDEAENIARMIDILVLDIFPSIKNHTMKLLIVDDNSPDNTGKIVKEKMKKNKNIFLLEGEKQGLGAAYRRGFTYAIEKLTADAVMEMDADFQHNPKDIPRFVTALDDGYDYILGSRFIHGGSIPKDWGIKRVILSIVGNFFIRSVFSLWKIHDLTTGYRLARVKALEKIDFTHLYSDSYAYKIHLLYKMIKNGAKIKEIPIRFVSREKGWSKMDSEDFFESLRIVFKIRFS